MVDNTKPDAADVPESGENSLVEAVRRRCEETAREAYEIASMRGVCHEGAWEIALGALRAVDLTDLERSADRELTHLIAQLSGRFAVRGGPAAGSMAAAVGAMAAGLVGWSAGRQRGERQAATTGEARRLRTLLGRLADEDARLVDAWVGGEAVARHDLGLSALASAVRIARACARTASLAAETLDHEKGALSADLLEALRLASEASTSSLHLAEQNAGRLGPADAEAARRARRDIWRTRLVITRARARLPLAED